MNLSGGGVDLNTLQNAAAAPILIRGRRTYVAGTTGAVGVHNIFTFTGMVAFQFTLRTTTDLTSGGVATLAIGAEGSPTELLSTSEFTTFVENAVANNEAALYGNLNAGWNLSSNGVVALTIADATVTGGEQEFFLQWLPFSAGASVALGTGMVAI